MMGGSQDVEVEEEEEEARAAIEGMSSQSFDPVAIEPAGPHLRTN